ncbi:unnamed protein product [Linum tenue]|nr:unnamed protein product [Linum tenue]
MVCRNVRRLLQEMGGGSWRHIRRTANEAAHVMAQHWNSSNGTNVWVDSPPGFLVNQLHCDNVTPNAD